MSQKPHKRVPIDRYQKTLVGEITLEEGIGDSVENTMRTLVTHNYSKEVVVNDCKNGHCR